MSTNKVFPIGFLDMLEDAKQVDVHIELNNEPAAVMVSPERYAALVEAYEEIEDLRAFNKATEEEGANIPWKVVQKELGWK